MTDIAVDDTQELRDYAEYMKGKCVEDFEKIKKYCKQQGCNKSGFTGLFEVVAPAMDVLNAAFEELAKFGEQRLRSGAGGLEATAKAYDDIEEHNKKNFLDVESRKHGGEKPE